MKLFMVIYVGAKVAGSIGPLPYDMGECVVRAAERNADLATSLTRFESQAIPFPREVALMDFRCEEYEARPLITLNQ